MKLMDLSLPILIIISLGPIYSQDHGHHHAQHNHHPVKRLRHSRHLSGKSGNRGPSAEALHSYEAFTATGAVVASPLGPVHNNQKPIFVNCSRYEPTVLEEEHSGTFVFQVKAEDKDPIDSGGLVTYAFVSAPGERQKFNINASTGEITTRHIFDRDEPAREKEVYLTVRATDNGRPQLDDVCTIKIKIDDINDNSPVFDKVSYSESVPQDLSPGNEVMRISATDIDDGNNSKIVYSITPRSSLDQGYFHVDENTGVIILDKTIDKATGYLFQLTATASDRGTPPNSESIDLKIEVVDSTKKAPTFIYYPDAPIFLKESMNNYTGDIATLQARSNIPGDDELVFELVIGRTAQTNKDSTFRLESDGTSAFLKLSRPLDYESTTEYTLTVRVQNKYNLAAETKIDIKIEDVNDNIPIFLEVISGSVLEHEPPGTPVMQIRAIDADGTSENKRVLYSLADHQDIFAIDSNTGNITTKVEFNREEKDFYIVKVLANDSVPSALTSDGKPNIGQQVFRIEIADKNDNPPRFTKKEYVAESVPEDANVNALVIEVKAVDVDTASLVHYSIVEGNTGDAFYIESITGKIRVKNPLDYETIENYTLTVQATDGAYEDYAQVIIKIENTNDNNPVFLPHTNNITIEEESLVSGCIVTLQAYDPDIRNRSEPQNIVFFVVKEDQKKLLHINNEGCLSLIKPLDHDAPNGYPKWQVLISAHDENGGPNSLKNTTEVIIHLIDINDNAPYLDMPHPVVWNENQDPGIITALIASDNDSEKNGPPFKFKVDISADADITTKFSVSDYGNGTAFLEAKQTFDREENKMYFIPIVIEDSGEPPQTGTSTLTVIIGDENDNPMKPGSSSIFMYNYNGEAPDTEIGRVYVEDLDDWDLPDKHFEWTLGEHPNFDLNYDTGMITMRQNTPEGTYSLVFTVTEESKVIERHLVEATVNVTIKVIPEEAVDKSGSIRLEGITAEEFVSSVNGFSKKDRLREKLAAILNVTKDGVDVFTVMKSPFVNESAKIVDVRFSAHASPYRLAEELNGKTAQHQDEIERDLGIQMQMINIDECLLEKLHCESSCTNFLRKNNVPYAVYTNTSSFVGVRAYVEPVCTCKLADELFCENGGTPVGEQCECLEGFEGPHCEVIDVGFEGDGWAWYPPLEACDNSHLSLEIQPTRENSLVFYIGPIKKNTALNVQDFMSLELVDGYPRLLVDYGSGTVQVIQDFIKVTDGKYHRIDVIWSNTTIDLKVDNCHMSTCLRLGAPQGPNEFLNVNGPLQMGGIADQKQFSQLLQEMEWKYKPTFQGYSGCIKNFTFNDKVYNLGRPSLSRNAIAGCNRGIAKAVSFGIDTNFLVAILVCIAILLILVLAVVVHRRKSDDMYKDADDIRENIINYEDEGGGEGDMTGYDLSVLRLTSDGHPFPHSEKMPVKDLHQKRAPDEVPDIHGFLDGKKNAVDNDPESVPFDDVRHYAYEGDGNSTGSLSSLASGTDEGDLNFDYLSNFGPRFRKLADMYGEHSSDEDDENFHPPASESWC